MVAKWTFESNGTRRRVYYPTAVSQWDHKSGEIRTDRVIDLSILIASYVTSITALYTARNRPNLRV
jgi:hypothetical protein